MQLVNGCAFLSEDFMKSYQKFTNCNPNDIKRTSNDKIPGISTILEWKMKDEHVFGIIKQLLEVLDYCSFFFHLVHREKKCVHKDLKPDNILVTHDLQLTLIDFGISEKEHGLHEGSCLGIKGTKMFCAPEVFDEKVA